MGPQLLMFGLDCTCCCCGEISNVQARSWPLVGIGWMDVHLRWTSEGMTATQLARQNCRFLDKCFRRKISSGPSKATGNLAEKHGHWRRGATTTMPYARELAVQTRLWKNGKGSEQDNKSSCRRGARKRGSEMERAVSGVAFAAATAQTTGRGSSKQGAFYRAPPLAFSLVNLSLEQALALTWSSHGASLWLNTNADRYPHSV